jgi:hypothetical protein
VTVSVKFEGKIALQRHARLLRRLKFVVGVVLFPLYVGCPLVWMWIVGALWGWEVAARRARDRLTGAGAEDGSLEVTGDALTVHVGNKRLSWPRGSVDNGWVEPTAGGCAATLQMSNGAMLFLRQKTFEEAARVLEAVGLGPRRRVLRVQLGTQAASAGQGVIMHLLGPWLAVVMGFSLLVVPCLAAIASLSVWSLLGVLILAVPVGLLYRFAQYVMPARCDIGSDGIVIRHLGERTFLPLADIQRADRAVRGVKLVVRGKERLLPTATPDEEGNALRDAIVWRIGTEIAERTRDDRTDRYALLARAERPLKQWRAEVVEQGRRAPSTYRQVDFENEELVRVVENRLGAAFLLSGRSVDEETKARVRVAADAVADPYVRVALAEAIDPEAPDEEIEPALVRKG